MALRNILLRFIKQPSMLQVYPQRHSATFWRSSKQQKHNSRIFTSSHLCCLLIFLNMSHCQTLCQTKSCSIPKQCLHNISSNQIACFFPGTHKLFHEPLFEILTPLLFSPTPSVFLQMVVFFFHKSIFDIVSALSLATSFVVSDIMNHLPILHSFHFRSS